ncbi:MAG: hypothetical protein ABIN79_09040 [Marmoricola sp.]
MPRLGVLIVGTVLVLTCASCSQDADGPNLGKPTTTTASPSTSPSLPSPTVPADLVKYAPEERAAYAGAVAALRTFSAVSDRFVAQGRLTKDQAAFYRRNSIDWVQDWANLAQLVNERITFKGEPKELWLRPASIDLAAKGGQRVVLRRCLDQRRLRVFADGKAVPQPQLKVPHVYRVTMIKKGAEAKWRTGIPRQGPKC